MSTILIATQNKAKLQEFHSIFQNCGSTFTLVSPLDLGIITEPDETGKTFKENAFIKAQYYANISHLPALADDGGPMIDALNGEPGVKSKLWLDRPATDEELIEYTLKRLQGVQYEKRTMSLVTVLCFYDPSTKKTIYSEGKVTAHLAGKPTAHYHKGFPFRALMYIDEYKKFYDELTPEEHEKINHRWKALQKIFPKIEKYLEKGEKSEESEKTVVGTPVGFPVQSI